MNGGVPRWQPAQLFVERAVAAGRAVNNLDHHFKHPHSLGDALTESIHELRRAWCPEFFGRMLSATASTPEAAWETFRSLMRETQEDLERMGMIKIPREQWGHASSSITRRRELLAEAEALKALHGPVAVAMQRHLMDVAFALDLVFIAPEKPKWRLLDTLFAERQAHSLIPQAAHATAYVAAARELQETEAFMRGFVGTRGGPLTAETALKFNSRLAHIEALALLEESGN